MKRYNTNQFMKIGWALVSGILVLVVCITSFAVNQIAYYSARNVIAEFQDKINSLKDITLNIDSLLKAEIIYDSDLVRLEGLPEEYMDVDTVNRIKRIKDTISNWSLATPYNIGYFIYLPKNKTSIEGCSRPEEYLEFYKIGRDLEKKIQENENGCEWSIHTLGEEEAPYLFRIIEYDKRYICCYISLEELVGYLNIENYGVTSYTIVETGKEPFIYENASLAHRYDLEKLPEERLEIRWFSGGVLYKQTFLNEIQIIVIVEKFQPIRDMVLVLAIFGLFLLICGILIFLWLRLLHRTIVWPIQKFNQEIEQYKTDNIYNPDTYYQLLELGRASQQMHEMVEKIKGLKIQLYEQSLEQQKTKMDFLTLKIEPHFYLNCLNNIYSMAQMKEYDKIKHMTDCVTRYLRYIFKSRDELVTVGEELKHVEDYLDIQSMRYMDAFSYEIDLKEEVLQMKIPSLILQTFVENAIKHTVDWEKHIILCIRGIKQEGEAVIRIEDNGDGFESEILYKLQSGSNISEGEKRIGIMNAVARMRLAFGEAGKIVFDNQKDGGAVVEIHIPIVDNKEE